MNYKCVKSDTEWKHVAIWIKPSEWDRINYLSASTGKSVSMYVIDKLMAFDGVVVPVADDKKEKGITKTLCVPADKWEIVKQKAKDCDMPTSKYLTYVILHA